MGRKDEALAPSVRSQQVRTKLMVINEISSHRGRRGEALAPPRADLKVRPYEVVSPSGLMKHQATYLV